MPLGTCICDAFYGSVYKAMGNDISDVLNMRSNPENKSNSPLSRNSQNNAYSTHLYHKCDGDLKEKPCPTIFIKFIVNG